MSDHDPRWLLATCPTVGRVYRTQAAMPARQLRKEGALVSWCPHCRGAHLQSPEDLWPEPDDPMTELRTQSAARR
jgi:hypothetical protein